MSSTSFSSGQSTSVPTVTPTPENSILDQIAGIAVGLGQQMASWAQGVFAKTSQVTDETVGNFLQASQQMMGLSGKMTDQYNNLFAPENAQLVADANSYASPSRMKADMGMAGATQAQAGQAAMRNSEQQLASFGIDPSSGRYAALDKADAVQNAANVAGAENMQRNTDIATGQQLRSEAVQVGSLLPSAISNATNTAIQANAGASNASLANANTGANLQDLANHYLSTAMGLKLSPVGQKSQSTNSGSSSSQQQQPRSGGGGGSGSGGGNPLGGQGGGGGGFNPNHSAAGSQGFTPAPGGGGSGNGDMQDPLRGADLPGTTTPMPDFSYLNGYGSGSGTIGNPNTDAVDPYGGGNPFSSNDFGQTYGPQDAGTFGGLGDDSGDTTGLGNLTYDPSQNATDPGWGNTYDQPGDPSVFGDAPVAGTDYSTSSSSDPGYSNWQDAAAAMAAGGASTGEIDDALGTLDGGAYAGGGMVRKPHALRPKLPRGAQPFRVNAAAGGQITQGMSPSQGAQTDDVSANLNAGEFVVPKDVAKWKGEEFFHNMIAQSRVKRQKMAAALGTGPQMRPQAPMGGRNGAA